LIWRRELFNYAGSRVFAKTTSSAENGSRVNVVDDGRAGPVIGQFIEEKGPLSTAFAPFAEVVADEFEENMRSAQTGKGNFAGLFQNFGLSSIDSPLQGRETRGDCGRDSDDNIGYLESGPQVGWNIHTLVLPAVLFLVLGGMTCLSFVDKIPNRILRCLVLIYGAIALCGAPVFALIGWGIANLIDPPM
jgi:hypothetical protein